MANLENFPEGISCLPSTGHEFPADFFVFLQSAATLFWPVRQKKCDKIVRREQQGMVDRAYLGPAQGRAFT